MIPLRSALKQSRGLAAAFAATTALLAPGSLAAQDGETTITAVMHSGLRVLDPVITTAHITRNHGYMVYDVLTAVDENFEPQPQMASWEVSEDGLVYTFTLRDGLMFHDDAPVTGEDVVASLKRWGKRDGGGQLIFDVTESLEASDEKTVVWTLTEPFGPLLSVIFDQPRADACLRPRWPYHHALGGRALFGGDTGFRRHRGADLSTRRRGLGRRAPDAGGRAVREVPL